MALTNHLQITLVDSNQSSPEVTSNAGQVRLEESAHKMLDVAMADANQTLTDAQYNGYGIYRCTGALTAQKNLVVPTRQKRSIVVNDTTGGYGIQVKTASGTGVVVPAGETTTVYSDGTNVRAHSGGGTGGSVTSVFTRTGAVVAATGDYDFTQLGDVPTDYTGDGGKVVKVKATEDGLEFATAASGVTLKTDGTSNGTQSILDLISGTGIDLTDNGDGTVAIVNTSVGGTPAWLNYHPDKPPSSPTSYDDEFDDTTGNSGTGNGLNARWSWVNQGTSTISYADNRALLTPQVVNGTNIRAVMQGSLPSLPCEFTCKLHFPWTDGFVTFQYAGMAVRHISGDDWFLIGIGSTSSTVIKLQSYTGPAVTGPLANGVEHWEVMLPPRYYRLRLAGTDAIACISDDGISWRKVRSMPFGTAFSGNTPDQIGFWSSPNNNVAGQAPIICEWFRRTL
jgi:hypothetical protein